MSDYLTNLIVRSREETSTVRPRLTSLFEPVRDSVFFPEAEPAAEHFDTVVPARSEKVSARNSDQDEPLAPSRTAIQSRVNKGSPKVDETSQPANESRVKPTIRPAREDRPIMVAAEVPEPAEPSLRLTTTPLTVPKPQLGRREIEPAATGTAERETSNQSRTHSTHEKPPVIPKAVGHLVLPPEAKESTHPPGGVEPNIAKPENPSPADQRPSRKASSITNHETSLSEAARIVTRIQAVRAEPGVERRTSSRTADPVMPSLVSKPAAKAAELSLPIMARVANIVPVTPEPIETESSEPVINVTIGRVEVRAVAAATAKPAPPDSRKGSQLMSLDDYLRQRAKGGRR